MDGQKATHFKCAMNDILPKLPSNNLSLSHNLCMSTYSIWNAPWPISWNAHGVLSLDVVYHGQSHEMRVGYDLQTQVTLSPSYNFCGSTWNFAVQYQMGIQLWIRVIDMAGQLEWPLTVDFITFDSYLGTALNV